MARKNSAAIVTMIKTITVVIQTSFQVGHVTFAASWRTSWRNWNGFTVAALPSWVMGYSVDDTRLSGHPAFQHVRHAHLRSAALFERILSLRAKKSSQSANRLAQKLARELAGAEGLEPPTFGFGDRRSTN